MNFENLKSFMNDLIYPNELEFYIELKNKYIMLTDFSKISG